MNRSERWTLFVVVMLLFAVVALPQFLPNDLSSVTFAKQPGTYNVVLTPAGSAAQLSTDVKMGAVVVNFVSEVAIAPDRAAVDAVFIKYGVTVKDANGKQVYPRLPVTVAPQ